ncbi:enterobactin transporter EntS [Nonomuraea sp. NPDC050404]|uniref:enterobactin transporter EntS n=1 Tax=Nonomuraea sp. NPDC050404 TaxID=3155783 RepID=UPI0033F47F74
MPPRRLLLDFSPLRRQGFRNIFFGRTVAVFGIGFVMVAVPLQVYSLTGSTADVAAVSAAVGVATFAGTMLGGVLADRRDRRRVIIIARATAAVAFVVLAGNALLPEPMLPVIYFCGMLEGLANGVSGTALMAATPALVSRDKLAAAGALMALMSDIGSVTAPALGGLLVAQAGFWANYAVCAVAGIVTVLFVGRLPELPPPAKAVHEPPLKALGAGLRYVSRDRIVGPVLLAGLVASALTGWNVLLPEFGREALGLGPRELGLLYAAPAAGALLATLTSGWTGTVRRKGATAMAALLVSAAGLTAVSLPGGLITAAAGLVLFGVARVTGDVMRYAIVQEYTPDDFRGRVAGLWSAQMAVGLSLGAAVAGGISALVPPERLYLVHGALGMTATLALILSFPALRRMAAAPVPD